MTQKRELLARCSTPQCGAKLDTLDCASYDPTVCYYTCPQQEKDNEQMELWPEWEPNDDELEEMEHDTNNNIQRDLNGNAERR